MTRQNDLLINWGVIILGALVALVVTTRVHKAPLVAWLFVLVGSAATVLIGSLWAGVLFQRRLTYLVQKPLVSVSSLNELLLAQSELLEMALIPLGVFAAAFLVMIVSGRVNPVEP